MGRFDVLNRSDEQLLKDCDVDTIRPSGPGGRKADATESAVRIYYRPEDLRAVASESRSQSENRRRALKRLRREYARTVRHPVAPESVDVPRPLRPYLEQGLRINPDNPHYPFLVKLVLDLFEAESARLGPTAGELGVSTNRLVQFFAGDDSLWEQANRYRKRHGHHRLKA